jgi:hypothetical protein
MIGQVPQLATPPKSRTPATARHYYWQYWHYRQYHKATSKGKCNSMQYNIRLGSFL